MGWPRKVQPSATAGVVREVTGSRALWVVDAREIPQSAAPPRPITVPDWIPDSWTLLLPGSALWALALYIPLSVPLARLEEALSTAGLSEENQQVLLITASLLLALAVGVLINLVLSWALGPGWGSSFGLVAALYGLFWGLAASRERDRD